jgi:hypothetical protein
VSADPDSLTIEELPECLAEFHERLSAVESELQFVSNWWMVLAFAVPLPRTATRDPRILPRRRPRQKGHL